MSLSDMNDGRLDLDEGWPNPWEKARALENKLVEKENEYEILRIAALNVYIDLIEQEAHYPNEEFAELGYALGYRCIVCEDCLAEEEGGVCIGCLDEPTFDSCPTEERATKD